MASPPLPALLADAQGFSLQILSLAGELWNGEVREVSVPGSNGRFGVMARHAPLLGTLREGMVSVYPLKAEPPLHVYVSGGYVEVQPGKVIVMADLAVRSDDLDEGRARVAAEAARSPMAQAFTDEDYVRLHAELMHQRAVQLRGLPWK
ncbi:ATP synthase F1 subunit epsilon [Stenotrophomonas rhizophila]|uniref:ATP synthase F1 subunit epsilon n=1 Tax=Stenotrophomonas rhizophila TaxID=216778 RepID=UPI00081C8A51|nr:ATP synthase F1 subunit epsilon [Stenotrophomonas rhizophila]AOA72571.1 ATP synthase F1 subunit epsilon [Stenotrophomonas rhizophila]